MLRFKTCEITIRVQPFKFSNQETPQTFSNPTTINLYNTGNTTSKPKKKKLEGKVVCKYAFRIEGMHCGNLQ